MDNPHTIPDSKQIAAGTVIGALQAMMMLTMLVHISCVPSSIMPPLTVLVDSLGGS